MRYVFVFSIALTLNAKVNAIGRQSQCYWTSKSMSLGINVIGIGFRGGCA